MTDHKQVAVGTILLAFLVGGGNEAAPTDAATSEVSEEARLRALCDALAAFGDIRNTSMSRP
jgi:hypothetical protein